MYTRHVPFNPPPDVMALLKTPEMWEELIAQGIEDQLKPEAFGFMPLAVQEAYQQGKELYKQRKNNPPRPLDFEESITQDAPCDRGEEEYIHVIVRDMEDPDRISAAEMRWENKQKQKTQPKPADEKTLGELMAEAGVWDALPEPQAQTAPATPEPAQTPPPPPAPPVVAVNLAPAPPLAEPAPRNPQGIRMVMAFGVAVLVVGVGLWCYLLPDLFNAVALVCMGQTAPGELADSSTYYTKTSRTMGNRTVRNAQGRYAFRAADGRTFTATTTQSPARTLKKHQEVTYLPGYPRISRITSDLEGGIPGAIWRYGISTAFVLFIFACPGIAIISHAVDEKRRNERRASPGG